MEESQQELPELMSFKAFASYCDITVDHLKKYLLKTRLRSAREGLKIRMNHPDTVDYLTHKGLSGSALKKAQRVTKSINRARPYPDNNELDNLYKLKIRELFSKNYFDDIDDFRGWLKQVALQEEIKFKSLRNDHQRGLLYSLFYKMQKAVVVKLLYLLTFLK